MKKINLHPSKIWFFLYPIYANLIVFGNDYESVAERIMNDFDLTPEQWGAVLDNWEYIHSTVLTD
jgi:hypothetical protein